MKLNYYCGCYKELKSLIDEPEDCEAEGTIEVDRQDWIDGIVCFTCLKCGAVLTQEMDHFNLN